MDFLDPKKKLQHTILLYTGYLLVGIAIIIGTIVLVYEAYGFGLGKNGTIIQNGFLYLSSQPNPANVYVNGKLAKSTTNTRLTLPSDIYNIELTKSGYRSWTRSIEIDGGTVNRYDYPLLIPNKLVTGKLKTYTAAPPLATQSPSRRWIVVEQPGSDTNFDLYDLSTKPVKAPTEITLPSNLVSKATSTDSWQLVAWANDNQHVLLTHVFDGKTEYIMLDITSPAQSFNLSQQLGNLSYSSISLDNEKYNQYYLYSGNNDNSLATVNLSTPTTESPVIGDVLSYATYGTNTVVYATTDGATANKVNIMEKVGSQTYHIKTFNAGGTYIEDIAGYNGVLYVVAADSAENKVFVYQDPVAQLAAQPKLEPVPSQVLFVKSPNYVKFSANSQFILAEGGQQFGVYDLQNQHGYNYTTSMPLDSPQIHATWMDGDRITYVSGGKLIVFDYDHNYQQTLVSASSQYLPLFAPNYDYFYTLAPSTNSGESLTQTSFYIPADQP